MKTFKATLITEAEDKLAFDDFDLDTIIKTLEKEITRLIDVPVKLTYKIEKDKYFRFVSQDLTKDMKPRMFKTLRVINLGGEINKTGEIWLSIKYEYVHIGGGSDGCEIAQVWVDTKGEITRKSSRF